MRGCGMVRLMGGWVGGGGGGAWGARGGWGGGSRAHRLGRRRRNVKKKIKQFEDQFEKDRNYKVSQPLLGSG